MQTDDDAMDQLLRDAMATKVPQLSPGFDARVLRRVRPRRLTPLGRVVIGVYVVVAAATAAWLMRRSVRDGDRRCRRDRRADRSRRWCLRSPSGRRPVRRAAGGALEYPECPRPHMAGRGAGDSRPVHPALRHTVVSGPRRPLRPSAIGSGRLRLACTA